MKTTSVFNLSGRLVVLALLTLLTTPGLLRAQSVSQPPVRVACIGNSITYGAGIDNRDRDSYPAVLGQMLGAGYDVRNFGFSARQLIRTGDFPYMNEPMYREALAFAPDIVVIKLGTNDSKPQNWCNAADFKPALLKMLADLDTLSSHPRVYLCYPAKAYGNSWGINDSIIVHGIIPLIREVAEEKHLPVIDLHTATDGMPEHFPDKIHPDATGAIRIAETVYHAITGKRSTTRPKPFPV